jgi:hypothetical protein
MVVLSDKILSSIRPLAQNAELRSVPSDFGLRPPQDCKIQKTGVRVTRVLAQKAMFLANKQNTCSNAFSCNGYCVFCFARDDVDFAETLSICATRVRFASAMLLATVEKLENADDRCTIGSDSSSGFVVPHPLNASSWRRSAPVQMFPVNARMITIKRISPNPPLGQYPQPPLYGQAGSAPTKSRIRMINRMVPMGSSFPALCSSTRRILDALKDRRPEDGPAGPALKGLRLPSFQRARRIRQA